MPKETFSDYRRELEFQRQAWERKPSLRALYRRWHARIVSHLSPARPVVEIGAGCGNFKSFFPQAVATDVYPCGPWIDRVVDARDLPFEEGEVGNLVMIDCLHHLPRPLKFLRSATQALKTGGRIVLFEPAATPWARFVFSHFHHEKLTLQQDLFAEDNQSEPPNVGFLFNNLAIAELLFGRGRARLADHLPGLRLVATEYSDFLVYPAIGGFSYRSFVPAPLVPVLHTLEDWITRPLARRLTAMRMLVALEKC